jgi:RNA polymerase sigma-70 factor (ECF subfamily)
MPAEAWAVQFPVGKCSHPASHERVERSQHTAKSSPFGDPEQSGEARETEARSRMLSQVPRRIDDTMLVREAQRGSRAAFEELVHHYDQAVLRLALHLTGSEHEAQDIYQDAFLKAYKNIGRFRFECSFYTWIYRIVTNLCLDNIRKKQVRKEDAPVAKDSEGESFDVLSQVADIRSGANPERDLMRRELGGRISRALEKLTPRERMVFELKHYQGLKLRTVGEMLNTTEETAKNTLFRATQKLRGALADMR